MRNTFLSTLVDIAAHNEKVWLLCGDLGYSVLEPFFTKFPGRYINVGVAEQNMAGMAAGLALTGKTVFIYSIGNFPTLRCLEQIRNDVCYHGADVKVVAVGAGYAYGSQGYTHHAIEDLAAMTALPGMEVFTPSDPVEVRNATRYMAGSGRPSYLRLSRTGEPKLPGEQRDAVSPRHVLPRRPTMIVTAGAVADMCLQATEILAKRGLEVGLVTVPRLKPVEDSFFHDLGQQADVIVTVEEHVLRGGLFAALAAATVTQPRRPKIVGLGIPESVGKPAVAGSREELLAAVGLSAQSIADRIVQLVEQT